MHNNANNMINIIPILSSTMIFQWFTITIFFLFTLYIYHTYITKKFKNQYNRQVNEVTFRWQQQHEIDQRSTVVECFSLGWFNTLVRAVWPSILERFFSKITFENIEKALARALVNHGHKMPWKLMKGIAVESVTLGILPPQFKICSAKYNPIKQYLKLEADAKWNASGFQIILCPEFKTALFKKTRFLISTLEINGKMVFGINLVPEAPGISSIDISFAETPYVKLRVTPMGLDLKDFPGIPEAIRNQLVKLLTKEMIEPKRRTINLIRIYKRQRSKMRSGPGGLLSIKIKSLNYINKKEIVTIDDKEIDNFELYCECIYRSNVYRTPVRIGKQSVEWDWEFGIPLEANIENNTEFLKFEVLTTKSFGEPSLIAYSKFELCGSELIADGESINLNVVMTSNGDDIVIGTLSIEMALMKNTRTYFNKDDMPSSPTNSSPHNKVTEEFDNISQKNIEEADVDEEAIEKLELLKSVLSNDVVKTKQSRDTNSNASIDLTEENNKETAKSVNISISHTESLHGSDSDKSILSVNPPFINNNANNNGKELEGFGNLEQVTRLEALMTSQLEQHKEQILYYKKILKDLEVKLKDEVEWRMKIQMKALVEGGRFLLNKMNEKVNKCVWLSPSCNSIKIADKRINYNHKEENDKESDISSFEINLLKHVELGTKYFPKSNTMNWGPLQRLVKKTRRPPSTPISNIKGSSLCFSLIFTNEEVINLEIPLGGNGRSLEEWVAAFKCLIESYNNSEQ